MNYRSKNSIRKPRILLLDDSKAFLSGLCSLLQNSGYELICHSSAHSALDDIKVNNPDVIVCDLSMPEMHGFDFIEKIKQQEALSAVPILVLTGQTDTETMSKSITKGADAFCSKNNIRYVIEPQLQALLRLKTTYENAIRGKQLEAVKNLIGTYKHEFGNALTILEGMIRKLTKNNPVLQDDPAKVRIDSSIERITKTLEKLDKLSNYEEEPYSPDTKILKVS